MFNSPHFDVISASPAAAFQQGGKNVGRSNERCCCSAPALPLEYFFQANEFGYASEMECGKHSAVTHAEIQRGTSATSW